MTDQPDPLTPPDCDLRDFPFMPLDVVRLRDSDLAATESAEAFRAAVMLWCASWHQLPAASLPDDDRVLANLAGYGRVVKEWQKEREGALRGWIKCSDGRLYHPVVAEKATEAWRGKLERQWRTECARIKKHSQRHGIVIEPLDFDVWLSSGRPQGQQLSVPKDKQTPSPGQEDGCLEYVPGETGSKGQGEGQGEGQGQGQVGNTEPDGSPSAPKPPTIPACPHLRLLELFGQKLPGLPQPKPELWDGKSADAMRARWKWLLSPSTVRKDQTRYATNTEEAMDWFGRFFDFVADSDFLMGRSSDFRCTLQWLMNKENFSKVVQGNFANKGS